MSIINKATDTVADALMAIATNEKLAEKIGELVTDMTVLKAEFKIEQEKTAMQDVAIVALKNKNKLQDEIIDTLLEKNVSLEEKNASFEEKIATLEVEIAALKKENERLRNEIASLRYANEILENENEIIKKEVTKQNYKIAMMENANAITV